MNEIDSETVMNISQKTVLSLSDKSDNGYHRQTEYDINVEASSNVDFGTHDVTMQPTPTSAYRNQIQESLSLLYETLDNTTQVVKPHEQLYQELNNDVWCEIFPLKDKQIVPSTHLQPISDIPNQRVKSQPYEELNNDVWNEIFPTRDTNCETIQLQPISDNSHELVRTKTHDPHNRSELNKTNQIVIDQTPTEDDLKCSISPSLLYDGSNTPGGVTNPPLLYAYPHLIDEIPSYEHNDSISHLPRSSFEVLSSDLAVLSSDNSAHPNASSTSNKTDLNELITSARGKEHDSGNEYESIPAGHEPLMDETGPRSVHRPTGRPLPVIPQSNYDDVNENESKLNFSNTVSCRTCISIAKIVFVLTVLVVVVSSVVVVITMLVLAARNNIEGKLLVFLFNISFANCPDANNESSEVFDIIKPGRRVKLKRSQAVNVHKLLTIRYLLPGQ